MKIRGTRLESKPAPPRIPRGRSPAHPSARSPVRRRGSAAERAGLRAGDVLSGFSFRREPDAPARIVVKRGGESLTFTYLPAREITIPRIQPTDASRRVIAALRGATTGATADR